MLELLGGSRDPSMAPFASAAQDLFRTANSDGYGGDSNEGEISAAMGFSDDGSAVGQRDLGLLGNALLAQWRRCS